MYLPLLTDWHLLVGGKGKKRQDGEGMSTLRKFFRFESPVVILVILNILFPNLGRVTNALLAIAILHLVVSSVSYSAPENRHLVFTGVINKSIIYSVAMITPWVLPLILIINPTISLGRDAVRRTDLDHRRAQTSQLFQNLRSLSWHRKVARESGFLYMGYRGPLIPLVFLIRYFVSEGSVLYTTIALTVFSILAIFLAWSFTKRHGVRQREAALMVSLLETSVLAYAALLNIWILPLVLLVHPAVNLGFELFYTKHKKTVMDMIRTDKLNTGSHLTVNGEGQPQFLTLQERTGILDQRYHAAQTAFALASTGDNGKPIKDQKLIQKNIEKAKKDMNDVVADYFDLGKYAQNLVWVPEKGQYEDIAKVDADFKDPAGLHTPGSTTNWIPKESRDVVAIHCYNRVMQMMPLTKDYLREIVSQSRYAPPGNLDLPLLDRFPENIDRIKTVLIDLDRAVGDYMASSPTRRQSNQG